MITTASYKLYRKDFSELSESREFEIPNVNNLEFRSVSYFIFCSEHIPTIVGKVKEYVIPVGEELKVIVRFSELYDVWGLDSDTASKVAYHHEYRGDGSRSSFPDDEFYPLTKRVDPIGFDTKFISLETAAEKLAATYRVDISKVSITISS